MPGEPHGCQLQEVPGDSLNRAGGQRGGAPQLGRGRQVKASIGFHGSPSGIVLQFPTPFRGGGGRWSAGAALGPLFHAPSGGKVRQAGGGFFRFSSARGGGTQ